MRLARVSTVCALALGLAMAPAARADDSAAFLKGIKHFTTVGSTTPPNGDQNPYAVLVAPVSAGKIKAGDVLVTNFNNSGNLQGLGTTIVAFAPGAKKPYVYAQVPRHLAACPGGIGFTTALAMLKTGWVIVGSLPSQDGTTATKGQGCLLVLNPQGEVASVITSPNIDGPWGNMAFIDNGANATLFLSNTGFGVKAPGQDIVNRANVVRLELTVADGKPPVLAKETVIGSGFGEQPDKDVFVIGPTGLVLGANGTLYVSDALGNRIAAIPDATTRTTSAGTGTEVTKDGFLRHPLAMVAAPNGHLLVTNAQNGQCVEIDPETGKQVGAIWIDTSRAQTPPGNGNLFGIAMTPEGDGFYYVKDEVGTLAVAR